MSFSSNVVNVKIANMAAKRKNTNVCEVEFEGIVPTSTRSKLITEFICFVLYQRNQLPLPYSEIRKQDGEHSKDTKPEPSLSRMGKGGAVKLEARKRQATIDAIESVSQSLDEVFAFGYDIRTVLLLLGPTIVSPKEIYEIKLPVDYHDGKILTLKKCQNLLFSRLISSDMLMDVKDLSNILKMTVMIEAPEDCNFGKSQLLTKPTYRIPKHGHHFVINMKCNADVFSTDVSHVYDTSFDISGIDILDKSVNDSSHITLNGTDVDSSVLLTKHIPLGVKIGEPLRHSSEVEAKDQLTTPPQPEAQPLSSALYLWYQIPVTVTGFKDKNTSAS